MINDPNDVALKHSFRISDITRGPQAPALLPGRNFLNMRVLQSIREAQVRIPLSRVRRAAGGGTPEDDRKENRRRPLGTGTYFLSYLDRDVLVGRAASGGVFIFRREEELSEEDGALIEEARLQ